MYYQIFWISVSWEQELQIFSARTQYNFSTSWKNISKEGHILQGIVTNRSKEISDLVEEIIAITFHAMQGQILSTVFTQG